MKRVYIKVPEWLDAYFTKKSQMTGVSKSSLMYLALEDYYKQEQVVNTFPELIEAVKQVDSKLK